MLPHKGFRGCDTYCIVTCRGVSDRLQLLKITFRIKRENYTAQEERDYDQKGSCYYPCGFYDYFSQNNFCKFIAPQYTNAEDFSEGYAMVKMNDGWYIIDLEGQIVY